jgi:hypothetical protein
MHGGIGRSINSVEQIEKIERPITMDAGSIVLMDLLWYPPFFFFHFGFVMFAFFLSYSIYTFEGLIPQKMIAWRV